MEKVIIEQIHFMCKQLGLKETESFKQLIEIKDNINISVKNMRKFNYHNAKIVDTRKEHRCNECNALINKGAKALTYLTHNEHTKSGLQRQYLCVSCAKTDDKEIKDCIESMEPDWDDGYSSNGY